MKYIYKYKEKTYNLFSEIEALLPNIGFPTEPTDEQLKEFGIEREVYVEPLEELKKRKKIELNQQRYLEELKPIVYLNKSFDYDERARNRINDALVALELKGNGAMEVWTLADNTTVKVNADDLRHVIANASIRQTNLHKQYKEACIKVAKATSKEELDKITL